MMNIRIYSTLAGAGMIVSLLIGIGVLRLRSRKRSEVAEFPPYTALLV
jgi:hypothetical protein